MRCALLLFTTLIAFSVIANIQSSFQLYVGEKKPDTCGEYGRLVTPSELENIENVCSDIRSQQKQQSIDTEDNPWWLSLSNNDSCQIKPVTDAQKNSLCVMRSDVPANTAYLFAQADFKGNKPWDGKADVNHVGEQVTEAQVNSFRLGRNVELAAYPQANFNGSPQVFLDTQSNTPFEIRSYKLDAKNREKDIILSFFSSDPDACITLVIPSLSPMMMCRGGEFKILAQIKELLSHVMIEIYLFTPTESESSGNLYLVFNERGSFSINYNKSQLPTGMTAKQQDQELRLIYIPE